MVKYIIQFYIKKSDGSLQQTRHNFDHIGEASSYYIKVKTFQRLKKVEFLCILETFEPGNTRG